MASLLPLSAAMRDHAMDAVTGEVDVEPVRVLPGLRRRGYYAAYDPAHTTIQLHHG